jgi:hypothetical protein
MILFCGFQRGVSHIWGCSLENGLDHIKYNMCCLKQYNIVNNIH